MAKNAIKIMLDYGIAFLGMLIISPILLVLSIIVRVDSPGPILHRRRVMGRNRSQFDAFKFRTMHVNGDAILAAHPDLQRALAQDQKLKDDPRVTNCGRWMRKLSLDELPQLMNVLRGEMSLVGPRMISPPELVRYGEYADELLTVKPGITGLWQVSGRSDLPRGDRVRLDLLYVRTHSVNMDIALLIRTVPALLRARGAY